MSATLAHGDLERDDPEDGVGIRAYPETASGRRCEKIAAPGVAGKELP